MAINTEEIRWASQDVVDNVSGLNNKIPPTSSQKNVGLVREEPLSRNHLNYQLDAQYRAMVELQNQIDNLAVNAGASLIGAIFPVGAYYITENTSNPATTLGVGTWTRVQGRMLIGRSDTDTDFDGMGEEGGSKNHTHANTLAVAETTLTIAQIPQHTHSLVLEKQGNNKASEGESYATFKEVQQGDWSGQDTRTTTSTGSSQGHTHALTGDITTSSNLPPYRAVNIWRRTA